MSEERSIIADVAAIVVVACWGTCVITTIVRPSFQIPPTVGLTMSIFAAYLAGGRVLSKIRTGQRVQREKDDDEEMEQRNRDHTRHHGDSSGHYWSDP